MENEGGSFEFQTFSDKQKKLLTWWTPISPYCEYDMIICDGSIRSGKTVSMILSYIQWSSKNFKHCDFIIAGRSTGALKRNVLNPMFKILNALGIKRHYNRSENYIVIGTNTYYLFGANNEASQDTLQGLTAAGAYADEAALMPESFINQMIGRCSIDGSKVWMNCNPEGPYHPIKKDYIDKAAEKQILHLHFDLDDNLSLSPKVKERYKRMFSGLFYKRFILGLWALAEGVIYDMWDDDENTFDDNDLIPGFKSLCKRYIAMDYGTSNPMVFLDIWDDGDILWIMKEYYYSGREKGIQKDDSQYTQDFLEFISGDEDPLFTVLDPSAASLRVSLRNQGYMVKEANNDVIPGIRTVSTMLTLRKIRVHRQNCPRFIEERSNYIWDDKAAAHGEEKPVKNSDHAMDALRYFCHTMIKSWRLLR